MDNFNKKQTKEAAKAGFDGSKEPSNIGNEEQEAKTPKQIRKDAILAAMNNVPKNPNEGKTANGADTTTSQGPKAGSDSPNNGKADVRQQNAGKQLGAAGSEEKARAINDHASMQQRHADAQRGISGGGSAGVPTGGKSRVINDSAETVKAVGGDTAHQKVGQEVISGGSTQGRATQRVVQEGIPSGGGDTLRQKVEQEVVGTTGSLGSATQKVVRESTRGTGAVDPIHQKIAQETVGSINAVPDLTQKVVAQESISSEYAKEPASEPRKRTSRDLMKDKLKDI